MFFNTVQSARWALSAIFIVTVFMACGEGDDPTGPGSESSSAQGTSSNTVSSSSETQGSSSGNISSANSSGISSAISSGTSSVINSNSSSSISSSGISNVSSSSFSQFNPNVSYGEITDSRDGKSYKTTTIGTQVWMAENLNFETASGSYCYSDSTTNCDTYGRLYTWSVAMDGTPSSSASPSGIQGVCPSGWHLPSDDEWETLASFVAAETGLTGKNGDDWTEIGQKIKSITSWKEYSGISSNDAFGFSALPGGPLFDPYNGNYIVGYYGNWWSSTEFTSTSAYYRYLNYSDNDFYRDYYGKSASYSVRCVMN